MALISTHTSTKIIQLLNLIISSELSYFFCTFLFHEINLLNSRHITVLSCYSKTVQSVSTVRPTACGKSGEAVKFPTQVSCFFFLLIGKQSGCLCESIQGGFLLLVRGFAHCHTPVAIHRFFRFSANRLQQNWLRNERWWLNDSTQFFCFCLDDHSRSW